jgi:hypothetical protein
VEAAACGTWPSTLLRRADKCDELFLNAERSLQFWGRCALQLEEAADRRRVKKRQRIFEKIEGAEKISTKNKSQVPLLSWL